MYRIMLFPVLAAMAAAQTQVDLRNQSRSVDFSGANPTKPMATGAVLPATCSTGQMFFLTSGASGQNLYGCVAPNIWSIEAGGGGGGSGVTVESAGTTVGTEPILNFTPGAGSLYAVSLSGSTVQVQSSADTSVLSSLTRDQAGATLLCASAGGSGTAYTCAMSPTLTQYTAGMELNWVPDVNASGGPTTLNVDFLGSKPLTLANGFMNPAPADVVAGRQYSIWYDGANFRLRGTVFPQGVLSESQPACSAAVGGRLWYVAGASGGKDSLSVCA